MHYRSFYIFDLDGTLSDSSHRTHLIGNKTQAEWDAYTDACDKDAPCLAIIDTLLMLNAAGAEIRIWTGRAENAREKTVAWLKEYGIVLSEHSISLRMRPYGDQTPDTELKSKWYDELDTYERHCLLAVFEDRTRMVEMWRNKGIVCFQVAPGNF